MDRIALPEGWTSEKQTRRGGVNAGAVTTTYRSPSGKRFRSLVAVNRHLVSQDQPEVEHWRRVDGNTCRNLPGRAFSGNDQYAQTPEEVKVWVRAQLGADLESDFFDVCPANPDFDGLAVDWHARNYCNPPYNNVEPWLAKAFEEHARGNSTMFLLPSRTSPMWFHRHVMRAHRVWYVPQGIKFEGYTHRTPFGMMLVYVDGARPLPERGPVSGSVDFHRAVQRFNADGRLR